MKFRFESPQKKIEEAKSEPTKNPETGKSTTGKKLRDFAIAATVLGVTTPALAQKTKNQEKKLEPIEVTDKNDPRLKAYNDSLKIYNLTKKDIDFDFPKEKIFNKYDETLRNNRNLLKDDKFKNEYQKAFDEYLKEQNEYLKNLRMGDSKNAKPAKYASYKGIKPISYKLKLEGDENGFAPVYKKPIQPYIYKKPEIKKDTVVKIQKPILERALDSIGKNPLPEIKETTYKPEPKGDIIYGPSNGAIGYMNEGKFTPIERVDHLQGGTSKTPGVNKADLDLLKNPSQLYKYLKEKYGEYFKGME